MAKLTETNRFLLYLAVVGGLIMLGSWAVGTAIADSVRSVIGW